MSKNTIQQKSLQIRNEQNPEGNSKERVADVIDDINNTIDSEYTKKIEFNEWREGVEAAVTSGIKGVAQPDDVITTTGFYRMIANTADTYTNYLDLNDAPIVVTDADLNIVSGVQRNEVIFEITNGVTEKKVYAKVGNDGANGTATIPQWVAGSYSPDAIIIYDFVQYIAPSGAIATDIPGESSKWIKLNLDLDFKIPAYYNIAKYLETNTFTSENAQQNKFLDNTGAVLNSAGYFITTPIKIRSGLAFTTTLGSVITSVCIYDINGVFIAGKNATQFTNTSMGSVTRILADEFNLTGADNIIITCADGGEVIVTYSDDVILPPPTLSELKYGDLTPLNSEAVKLQIGAGGKNLYYESQNIVGKGVNNTGDIIDVAWISARIPVKGSLTYSLIHIDAQYNAGDVGALIFEDENFNKISHINLGTLPNSDSGIGKKLTTPTNAAYIYTNITMPSLGVDYSDTFQLEEGASSTTYEAGFAAISGINQYPIISRGENSIVGRKKIPKKILILGDSISDENFSTWYAKFLEDYECEYILNLAHSGATWSHSSTTAYDINESSGSPLPNNVMANQVNKYISMLNAGTAEEVDVVACFAGANDRGRNKGDASVTFNFNENYLSLPINDVKLQNVTGGIRYTCEKLIQLLPDVKLVIGTPLLTGEVSNVDLLAVRASVVASAQWLAAPIIDLTYTSGIYPYFDIVGHKFLADNLHPNVEGGKMVASKIGPFLYNAFS